MQISSSQRFLLYLLLHVEGVFSRGGGNGGKGGIPGYVPGGAGAGADLSGHPLAALVVTIVLITAYQFLCSLWRFDHLSLPEGESTLPYDVGKLFPVFLASYTVTYLIYNILYIVSGIDFLLPFSPLSVCTTFTSQLSDVLFYATLLSIIAYRQRIQLNPGEKLFNLKSFLDGLLLATILALGVAEDGIAGNLSLITVANISLVYKIFVFIASLDVAVSSFVALARFSNAGIRDKIIYISAFAVSPITIIGGIFGIIEMGIVRGVTSFSDRRPLLIAAVAINGTVSIVVILCCLLMSAPPNAGGN